MFGGGGRAFVFSSCLGMIRDSYSVVSRLVVGVVFRVLDIVFYVLAVTFWLGYIIDVFLGGKSVLSVFFRD